MNRPKPDKSAAPTKTSWGNVADWYDGLLEKSEDSYQEKVIMPNLLRIVDPKPGIKILDVACGQGYFSRAFHNNGAQVVGCDISQELVGLARNHSPKEITYHIASADNLAFLDKSQTFDVVTIVLAIQNIKEMRTSFAEASRALKPGGRLVLVMNHPAFRIPQSSSWQWDEKSKAQYRRIDAYMTDNQIKIDMNPGEKGKAQGARGKAQNASIQTVSFHRPLQSYFKAMNSAGFAVTRLEEWISHKQSQEGPRADAEDRARKEFPLFMCVEGRKG